MHFYFNLFDPFIKILQKELNGRFDASFGNIFKAFHHMNPHNHFANFQADQIIYFCSLYSNVFSDYKDEEIRMEASLFIDYFGRDQYNNIQEVLIEMTQLDAIETFPIFFRLIRVTIAIGFTSAASERGFSKRDIIKNCLRMSSSDERSESLIISSINNDITKSISNEKLSGAFLEKKRNFTDVKRKKKKK